MKIIKISLWRNVLEYVIKYLQRKMSKYSCLFYQKTKISEPAKQGGVFN